VPDDDDFKNDYTGIFEQIKCKTCNSFQNIRNYKMHSIIKKISISWVLTLSTFISFSQNYSDDNKAYRTISWNEFFIRLERNPHLVFFDIRTDGERSDASQYLQNNQGRIQGAVEIDYYQIGKYYADLLKHKEDTIYLYCSHSMRSRRLAKQLSDSAFKNVVSVNGGMSYLNLMGNKTFPLRRKYYETKIKYNLISPINLEEKLKNSRVQVVDVRPDNIYNGTGGDEQDWSYGYIKGIKHIDNLKCKDSIALFDKTKEIILIDNYGDISPAVANLLLEKGFKKVGVLFYGLDQLRNTVPSFQRGYLQLKYPSILAAELLELKKSGNVAIIDIRTETEFNSTDTVAWKNVGRLKNAVNIPFSRLSEETLQPYRNKKLVIYDNMMMPPELYQAAELLKKYGIKDFALLSGGVFQINWELANTDKKYLSELLEKTK
jgi:rhodanese-related sulfurtransferase